MATINSAQSGNFSDPNTWVGGVVPTVGDTAVASSGHEIQLDYDVIVNVLQGSGGNFILQNDRTITVNVISGANTVNVITETESFLFCDNVAGGNTIPAVINVQGTGTFNFSGTINSATINLTSRATIECTSGVTNITGTIKTGNGRCLVCKNYASVSFTGVVDYSNPASDAVLIANDNSILNIIADIITDSYSIVSSGGNSLVSIVGNVKTVSIYADGHAIESSAQTNGIELAGDIEDSPSGTVAIYSRLLKINPTLNSRTTYYDDSDVQGQPVIHASYDVAGDHPVPADVREGVTYAFGQFTGTAKIPPVNAVKIGVPVDNTVGTAVLEAADVWNVNVNNIDEQNETIGKRLKRVATSEVIGAMIAAFKEPA